MSGDRGLGTNRGAACRRTRGVIDRIVADTLTAADREHAATCPDCGPVLARAARFDDALRRTARGFAVEKLPAGILDPGMARGLDGVQRGSALRTFSPGLAGIAAVVVIFVLATGVGLIPGGLVGPTPNPSPSAESTVTPAPPLFQPSGVIEAQATVLKYVCNRGGPLQTSGTRPGQAEREGVVCATPKEDSTKIAAIITGETRAGEVVQVTIKGELIGTTLEATDALAIGFAKLTFVAIADPAVAPLAGDWVNATLRELRVLQTGDSVNRVLGGIRFTFQRSPSGSYMLIMEPFATS